MRKYVKELQNGDLFECENDIFVITEENPDLEHFIETYALTGNVAGMCVIFKNDTVVEKVTLSKTMYQDDILCIEYEEDGLVIRKDIPIASDSRYIE